MKEEIKQEDVKPTAKVELDSYNSELHVKLSQDNLVGEILKGDGFQYMWGGVRGTHGVKRGMVRMLLCLNLGKVLSPFLLFTVKSVRILLLNIDQVFLLSFFTSKVE